MPPAQSEPVIVTGLTNQEFLARYAKAGTAQVLKHRADLQTVCISARWIDRLGRSYRCRSSRGLGRGAERAWRGRRRGL